ncbi:HPr family phosphocarrier protein [uncultured Megasphaera sp.]|uniref:HPr family phosphocarrier protein n=1 Tax=uncultured Megasphaera sp. TaxID=165188 RepID=UPI002657CE0E|nr:HPr family phosphocarrier protein [uncultured Megasphaera sp.]
MKEFTYVITDPQGIHARPAGLLVKEAKKFESAISIFKGSRKGDLKKIFTVMALGAKQGEEIKVTVEGADEEAAAAAVEAFLKANF